MSPPVMHPPTVLSMLGEGGPELPGPEDDSKIALAALQELSGAMGERLTTYIREAVPQRETRPAVDARLLEAARHITEPTREPTRYECLMHVDTDIRPDLYDPARIHPSSLSTYKTDPKFIQLGLALGGGGTRGYISSRWLAQLDETLRKEHKVNYIHQAFDCIAGTSIGGILALGLVAPGEDLRTPRLLPASFEEFFTTKSDQIFPKSNANTVIGRVLNGIASPFRKLANYKFTLYSADPLEKLLQETFKNLFLSHALTNVLVLATENETANPYEFSHRKAHLNSGHDFPMWQVGRSTSAGQTYFHAYRPTARNGTRVGLLSDGGLAANNPSLNLFNEMRFMNDDTGPRFTGDYSILFLGTGYWQPNALPRGGGKLDYAASIVDALFASQDRLITQSMDTTLGRERYFPVNVMLPHVIPLDSTDLEDFSIFNEAVEKGRAALEVFVNSEVLRKRLEQGKG